MKGVDDVLITPELAHHPARAPDYAADSGALTALAQQMASEPERVLQKVTELAGSLQTTGQQSFLKMKRSLNVFR